MGSHTSLLGCQKKPEQYGPTLRRQLTLTEAAKLNSRPQADRVEGGEASFCRPLLHVINVL